MRPRGYENRIPRVIAALQAAGYDAREVLRWRALFGTKESIRQALRERHKNRLLIAAIRLKD